MTTAGVTRNRPSAVATSRLELELTAPAEAGRGSCTAVVRGSCTVHFRTDLVVVGLVLRAARLIPPPLRAVQGGTTIAEKGACWGVGSPLAMLAKGKGRPTP